MSTSVNVSTSVVLDTFKTLKRQSGALQLFGWLCMPCCCVGAACLAPATQLAAIKDKYAKVVALYGGAAECKRLAALVIAQLNVFRKAVTEVNGSCDPLVIKADLMLHEVIAHVHPRIGKLIRDSNTLTGRLMSIQQATDTRLKDQYLINVYEAYTRLGGDYRVIVYGYPEYVARMYEPTCSIVEAYLDSFTKDTSFRAECLSHQGAVVSVMTSVHGANITRY